MKKALGLLVCAIPAIAALSGCTALGEQRLESKNVGCSPWGQATPFTPQYEACKKRFPAMANDFAENEQKFLGAGGRANVTQAQSLRVQYLEATRDGRTPDLAVIRDYKIPADLEQNFIPNRSVLIASYYRDILPYFYEVNNRSSEFVWTPEKVQIVQAQSRKCEQWHNVPRPVGAVSATFVPPQCWGVDPSSNRHNRVGESLMSQGSRM